MVWWQVCWFQNLWHCYLNCQNQRILGKPLYPAETRTINFTPLAHSQDINSCSVVSMHFLTAVTVKIVLRLANFFLVTSSLILMILNSSDIVSRNLMLITLTTCSANKFVKLGKVPVYGQLADGPTRRRIKSSRDVGELVVNPIQLTY